MIINIVTKASLIDTISCVKCEKCFRNFHNASEGLYQLVKETSLERRSKDLNVQNDSHSHLTQRVITSNVIERNIRDARRYGITKIGGLRVQDSRPLSDIYSDNTGRNSTG
ncbi:hypothetical protein QLX08_001905 [Tetragonisca angustula]|uniref:Uncharacterized protein n=1 Tax=Tetragonisca angustula TaxID=166442 RepID=A0AAW1AGT4_9HYME